MKTEQSNSKTLWRAALLLAGVMFSIQSQAATTVSIRINGDPATGPYSVEAVTNARGSVSIRFYDNDVLKKTESMKPYCLTPEANKICQPALLGSGYHKIVARVYNSKGQVLVQTTRVIYEGPAPSPTTTTTSTTTTTLAPTTTTTTQPPPPPPPAPSSLINETNSRVWLDPLNDFKNSLSSSTSDRKGGLLLGYLYPYYQPNIPAAQSIALNAIPTTGLRDPNDTSGNSFRFGTVVDENGKRVIRMRYVKGQDPVTLGGHLTHRYLMTFDSSAGGTDIKHIPHGEDVWVAYAFKAPSPVYRGKIEEGTGGSCGGDKVALGGVSTSRSGDSSVHIWLETNNTLQFGVSYNTEATRSTMKWQTPYSPVVSMPSGQWTYIIMKLRLNYTVTSDASQNPYTKIWVATGNSAPLNMVYNTTSPNAWKPDPTTQLYPYSIIRVGSYFWCQPNVGDPAPDMWTPAGSNAIQIDNGGTYVLPVAKVPGLTEQDLLTFLKSRTQ